MVCNSSISDCRRDVAGFRVDMSKFLAVIFGLGLPVSTAAQLRVAGPVGPGEALLVLWLALVVYRRYLYPTTLTGTPWLSSHVVRVWGLFLGALSVGIFIGQWSGLANQDEGVRDLLALVFVATLSIALSAIQASEERWINVVDAYISVVTIGLGLLLILAARQQSFLIDPWYQAIRFRGWSENPNQLALMLLALPYFCIWSFQRTNSPWHRSWLAACLVISGIAGALSLSEALYLAWGSSLSLCLVISGYDYFKSPTSNPLSAIWKKVTLPSLILGIGVAIIVPFALRAAELIAAIYAIGNQGETRLAIWRHGLEAALHSPVFGLGPGAFSGHLAPFQGSEAHSTFIDVLSQAGILGLAAYVALLIFVGKRIVAAREVAFIGAFTALVVFSCFHYVLRQPIFWLSLVLMVRLLALPRRKAASLLLPVTS